MLSSSCGRAIRVKWGPDGTLLATASDDRTVRVWRAGFGAPHHSGLPRLSATTPTLPQQLSVPASSSPVPPGGKPSKCSSSGSGEAADSVATCNEACVRVVTGHSARLWDVDLCGDVLVTGGEDRSVRCALLQGCHPPKVFNMHLYQPCGCSSVYAVLLLVDLAALLLCRRALESQHVVSHQLRRPPVAAPTSLCTPRCDHAVLLRHMASCWQLRRLWSLSDGSQLAQLAGHQGRGVWRTRAAGIPPHPTPYPSIVTTVCGCLFGVQRSSFEHEQVLAACMG